MMRMLEGEAWLKSRAKRSMDVGIVSAFGAPSVLLAGASAIALGIEMRRIPWFMQERVGNNPDEPILIPKLITLHGPADARHSAGYTHMRASRVGQVVRRLHIDESPQLLLVLQGHMSVVGVRPTVLHEHELILDALSPAEQQAYLQARSITPPGIVTVDAFRQHLGERVSPYEKAMNVIEYAHTANILVDSHLLLTTAAAVMHDHGSL